MRLQVIRAGRQLKATAASIPAKPGHLAQDDRVSVAVDGGGKWQIRILSENRLSQLVLVEMQLDAVFINHNPAYRGPQQLLGHLGRTDRSLKIFQAPFYFERRCRRHDQKVEQLLGRSQRALNCERTKASISAAGKRSGPEQF